MPAGYDVSYKHTELRVSSLKIQKPKENSEESNKIKKNDSPSPTSYDIESSYNNTQLAKPKFFIPKSKHVKVTDLIAKNNSFVPGIGTYNYEQSYNKISKGVGKSWK